MSMGRTSLMKTIYIIAEVGVNHNGSMALAYDLIDIAAKVGADAVKFQTFTASEIASQHAPKAAYQKKSSSRDETQLQMLEKLEFDELQWQKLFNYCRERNIEFLSSPFDLKSLKLLSRLGVSRLKIPSGEITNAPLLLEAAASGKKIILSTGMSNLGDIETALGVLAFGYLASSTSPAPSAFQQSYSLLEAQELLKEKVTLLHCTTEYPAPFEQVNLRAMDTLKNAFNLEIGYSDHSPGIAVPIAAAARGATVIEKHLTLDRKLPGPDHQASLEPPEFRSMVEAIRQVELALGSPIKTITPTEAGNRLLVRKSLVAAKAIEKGEAFTEENLGIKRPGTGISPQNYWQMLGQKAGRDYAPDELIE
jgi:N-acetylneuraminate synthase